MWTEHIHGCSLAVQHRYSIVSIVSIVSRANPVEGLNFLSSGEASHPSE
jgi:hypothetical protein